MLALLRRYGWNATSFQILEAGFRYWFDGDDACVAYVETRGAWVAAGAPVCAAERLGEVSARFVAAARAAGRRAAFFAAEARLVDARGAARRCRSASSRCGTRPRWAATAGAHRAGCARSCDRATNKGVRVRAVARRRAARPDAPLARAVDALIERWQHAKPMAPMGFLVDVAAVPLRRRAALLRGRARRRARRRSSRRCRSTRAAAGSLEDFLRDPRAPNGTSELLVDAAMRALGAEGSRYVTLGLAPLAGPCAARLRAARALSAALYDFEGLRAFKAKLQPHAWEPIFLAHPPGSSSHVALVDALAAFARGSFVRFGGETLLRGPALVVRALAAALVPWTVLLALRERALVPARRGCRRRGSRSTWCWW